MLQDGDISVPRPGTAVGVRIQVVDFKIDFVLGWCSGFLTLFCPSASLLLMAGRTLIPGLSLLVTGHAGFHA